MLRYFFIALTIFLFLPLVTKGVYLENVIINEICWTGTENSANNEWIVTIKHSVFL